MAGVFQGFPAAAGGGDGVRVGAVEHVDDAGEVALAGAVGAFDEDQEVGAVGRFVVGGEPDGVVFGVAFARRAMGQEAGGIVGPDGDVEGFDPFGRTGHDQGAHAALDGALQQPGERALERGLLEVVEADFRNRRQVSPFAVSFQTAQRADLESML